MNIKEREQERQKRIYDSITVTHMICFFSMFFIIAVNTGNISLHGSYGLLYIKTGLLFALIGGLIIFSLYYVNQRQELPLLSVQKRGLVDFLYFLLPLIFAVIILFFFGQKTESAEMVMFVPIIITASLLGKRAALLMATGCVSILFIYFGYYLFPNDIYQVLEEKLLIVVLLYIVAWFLGSQREMDDEYQLELKDLLNRDVLTGFYNHRYFQDYIRAVFEQKSQQKCALLIFDVDYFKHYNDIFGHKKGDIILKKLADIITRKIEGCGQAARIGGDEVGIFLVDTDAEEAKQVGREIQQEFRKIDFEGEEYQPGGQLTISCGIAAVPEHAANYKDLVDFADQALYKAKNINRDNVEVYFSVFDSLDIAVDEKKLLDSAKTLIAVINAKDKYTFGHSDRVSELAMDLAKYFDLDKRELSLLRYASYLHDIGKVEIPRQILNKSTALLKDEWEILKNHPLWGSEIVKGIESLQDVGNIILHHHENYDGTGYPNGKKGEEIPFLARIIRVVDSYDAMVTDRPYKKGMESKDALNLIRQDAGKHYDPLLVERFSEMVEESISIIKA